MTTFLDKEAVLKAANLSFYVPDISFVKRIERGEFDAKCGTFMICSIEDYNSKSTALAAKDAEIARLQKALFFVSTSASTRGKSILASFRIIGDLKHRITELEKLVDLQKGTIDAQGKALQEARMEERVAWMKALKDTIEVGLPDQQHVLDRVLLFVKEFDPYKSPAQKAPEPELYVCPDVNECAVKDCRARIPHEWVPTVCDDPKRCSRWKLRSGPCIPVPQPSPVPTSGPGTTPEGATVHKSENPCGENCPDCPAPCRVETCTVGLLKDPDCTDNFADHNNPGMAKDIGDLILRVDNLESQLSIEGKLQGEQNNKIAVLETALKSLQEEVKEIKKNPILNMYDPAPRTFTTPLSTGPAQTTGSYNPCANCQTIKDLQQRYPNGYTGDSPCAICPNNPNKVTCSK